MGSPNVSLHSAPNGVRVATRSLDELAEQAQEERVAAAHDLGRAKGQAQARATTCALVERVCAALDAARERALDEVSSGSVELAVEIARQLLKLHIQAGDYDLERIVRGALDDSGVGRGRCIVHVSPDDLDLLDGVVFRAETSIEPDPDLARGEIHVTTPRGMLVRDIESALESIREQLLEDLA